MSTEPSADATALPTRPANRFDRMEWAGAFGDPVSYTHLTLPTTERV